MARLILKKIAYLLVVLLCISFLSFLLANLSPIDPAEAYARRVSRSASAEMIEEYRQRLGFNKSIPEQYVAWLGRVVHLDLGNSYITGRPVLQELSAALPTTILLALLAAAFILIFSIPLGVLSAHYEGKLPDKIISGFSFVSISIPGYFVGLLFLLAFGMKLRLFPVIGHGNFVSILFAAFVLALPMLGSLARVLRSLILENKEKDYIQYAKARGIGSRDIMLRHLLPGAAPSCVTLFGQNIGYLIAGTAIVENIFSAPGIGQYALDAALNRDFPVMTGYIVIMAVFFVLCNLGAEIASTMLNPALRRERE